MRLSRFSILVPASDRFLRVQRQFWTSLWLGWPRCMARACMPPASTMAGLLLEQTDSTYNNISVRNKTNKLSTTQQKILSSSYD